MKEEDKLKDTLRNYYDAQQFQPDDTEWERAAAYLNTVRRRRNIKYGALIFVALLSALFTVLLNLPATTGVEEHQAVARATQAPQQATSLPPAQLPTAIAAPASPPAQHRAAAHNHAALPVRVTTLAQKNHSNNLPAQDAVITQQTPPVAEMNLVAPVAEAVPPAAALVEATPMDTRPASGAVTLPPAPAVNPAAIPATPADITPQPINTVVLTDTKQDAITTDTTKPTAPVVPAMAAVADTIHPATAAMTIAPAVEVTGTDTVLQPEIFDQLADKGIVYEVGAVWLYGWKGPVQRDARGISPVVGIHYMNRLSRRCALSFGVQYLQVSHLSNSSKTSRVSSYTYGEQSSVTVITPSSAYYLLAPFRFHYYIDRKNSFGMGINLAYLLTVEATVTSHDEKPGFNGNYKTIKQGGYTDGFAWYDSQLAFCYRRRIYNAFALQAELFIGLVDVKQDAFFDLHQKERNSGAKLSLVYYPFRKNGK